MKKKKQIKKVIKKLRNGYIAASNYIKYYTKYSLDDQMILIESQQGKEFNGNMYYIAKELATNEEYKDYKIYMSIIKAKEKDAKRFFENKKINNINFVKTCTEKYYKIISKAKFLINDNTFLPFFIKKEGQVYFNTWHGTPLKSLGKKIKDDLHNIGNAQKNFLMADYLLYPNEYTRDHILEDYMIRNLASNCNIVLEGYPRNTAFFDDVTKKEIKEKYNLKDKQIIAYMPTWRGTLNKQNSNVQAMNLEYIFEEMENNLKENQIFFVNLHPIEKASVDLSKYKKVRPFPAEYETYEFLNVADMLITDYSSVFFDFLNTGKKVILYVYDKEFYLENRGLYMSLEELPFPIVEKVKDLIKEINTEKNYDDTEFKNTFCKFDRKDSTKLLCEKIIKNKDVDININPIKGNGKKNVLIYGGGLAANGITTSLKNLINSIDRNRNNYYVVLETNSIKNNISQLEELSQYVDYIPIKGKMNFTLMQKACFFLYKNKKISSKLYLKFTENAYKLEIKRVFPNFKIDSIIHFSGYGYKKILLFSQLQCEKIIYAHNDMYKEATIKQNISLDILRYAYTKYDKIALVTEDLIEPINKIVSITEKYFLVHNIIDYKRVLVLSQKEIEFDKKTKSTVDVKKLNEILDSKNKKFITIGRFSKEKGHERLIDNFEKLWKKDSSIYLIIIGGLGIEYVNILERVEKSICKNNIIIIKYVSNPYTILKKCDYFILPSFYEGFGIVLAEADILGKPVVSTDVVGPAKFMKKYGGKLVENTDEGVYEGLELLYNDKVKTMNVDFEKYNQEAINEFESLFN